MKQIILCFLTVAASCTPETMKVNKIKYDIAAKNSRYYYNANEIKPIDNRIVLRENSAISVEIEGLSKLKVYIPEKHDVSINSSLVTFFNKVPKINDAEFNPSLDSLRPDLEIRAFSKVKIQDTSLNVQKKRVVRRLPSNDDVAKTIIKSVNEANGLIKKINQSTNEHVKFQTQLERAIVRCGKDNSIEDRLSCFNIFISINMDQRNIKSDSKQDDFIKLLDFYTENYFSPLYFSNHRLSELSGYLKSTREVTNYSDAIKLTDFKNDITFLSVLDSIKKQETTNQNILTKGEALRSQLVSLNVELNKLKSYPNPRSSLVSPKGADRIRLIINIKERGTNNSVYSDTIPTNTGIAIKGIKFDFSGGFFYSNLYDREYFVTQRQDFVDKKVLDNGVEKTVKEPATFSTIHTKEQKNYSLGLMTYAHMRLKGYKSVQPGAYFGTGLWLGDDTRLVYSLGGSLSFIAFDQRCAVHLGYILGNTKRLNSKYNTGVEYQESITEPQTETSRDGGLLFGLSINFNQKVKLK